MHGFALFCFIYDVDGLAQDCSISSALKVEYLIICIICDTDLVNKLILQVYTLHKYK